MSAHADRSRWATVAPRLLDLRMLVPALTAWAVSAATLGVRPVVLALAAAGCAVVAAVLIWGRSAWSRFGGRRSGGADAVWVVHSGRFRGVRGSRGSRAVATPGDHVVPSSGSHDTAALAALVMGAVALVLASTAGHASSRESGPVRALAMERAMVTVSGVVTKDPVVVGGARLDGSTVRFTLRVDEVTGRGRAARVSTPVLVVADQGWEHLRWHERVRVRGTLVSAEPGDDVVAVLRPRGAPQSLGAPGLVARAAEHLGSGLREAATPLPSDARGLLPALVIGDTSRTPQDLTDAMLATGMTHLSAVSGHTARQGVLFGEHSGEAGHVPGSDGTADRAVRAAPGVGWP